ncbi:MAG: ABC transporter permease subunit [Armatimonadetes bacterium]|nr:ABC transporter permease subunit [Armatimonadota bacterium]
MPLVGKVGRRSPRARIAQAVVYLLLTAGAVTTVYPFFFMVSTGFKGPTDQNDNKIVPAYWADDRELQTKYRDDKYAGDADVIASNTIGGEAGPATVGAYAKFLADLPGDQWKAGFRVPANGVTSKLALRWQGYLRQKYGTVDALNRAYTDLNNSFQQVTVPFEGWERKSWNPPPGRKWADWAEFKSSLPAEYRVPVRTEWMWQEFLRAKYRNRISSVPEEVRRGAKSFAVLTWNQTLDRATARAVRGEAVGSAPTPDSEREKLVDEFSRSLAARFQVSVESKWNAVAEGPLPIVAFETSYVREHASTIRSEFAARNYGYVLDYAALHGGALWNTVVFCLLAVLTQLTVNPLAAYALSRFPMKATAKILLFLLATMAFPAEVAMIPSFLLLKDLGLLNTFAALVLPTAASGYTIYLLKGFFDSLPQEVFDSGQVDGAPEWLMMLRLAMPLSKPVLGYIALLAFMGAYGSFIYAFLVCQDSRIWTLMVFVYQLQIVAPKAVVMAAVTLAALPTLVVFLACQRVIMRGIVLPGER